jgi:hypothetical protein
MKRWHEGNDTKAYYMQHCSYQFVIMFGTSIIEKSILPSMYWYSTNILKSNWRRNISDLGIAKTYTQEAAAFQGDLNTTTGTGREWHQTKLKAVKPGWKCKYHAPRVWYAISTRQQLRYLIKKFWQLYQDNKKIK